MENINGGVRYSTGRSWAEKTPSWHAHTHSLSQNISRLLSLLEQIATALAAILPYVWHFAKALLNINDR